MSSIAARATVDRGEEHHAQTPDRMGTTAVQKPVSPCNLECGQASTPTGSVARRSGAPRDRLGIRLDRHLREALVLREKEHQCVIPDG